MKSKIHIAIQRKKNNNEAPKPDEVTKFNEINNSNRFNPYKQVDEKKLYNQTQILMKTKY